MIDFNTIYNMATPYLGTSAIALLFIFLIYAFVKYKGVVKTLKKEVSDFIAKIKEDFENTENEALKAFKAALPNDLSINIESLTKREIAGIKEYFITAINDNWLKQMSTNSDLTRAMANALLSIKSIPDSSKEEISAILKLKDVETTDKLKVELLPVEEVIEEKEAVKPIETISVD